MGTKSLLIKLPKRFWRSTTDWPDSFGSSQFLNADRAEPGAVAIDGDHGDIQSVIRHLHGLHAARSATTA